MLYFSWGNTSSDLNCMSTKTVYERSAGGEGPSNVSHGVSYFGSFYRSGDWACSTYTDNQAAYCVFSNGSFSETVQERKMFS